MNRHHWWWSQKWNGKTSLWTKCLSCLEDIAAAQNLFSPHQVGLFFFAKKVRVWPYYQYINVCCIMIETGFFSKIVSDTVHSVGQAAVLWLQVPGSIPVSDYFLYFFPYFFGCFFFFSFFLSFSLSLFLSFFMLFSIFPLLCLKSFYFFPLL